jgi:hypothetical protein
MKDYDMLHYLCKCGQEEKIKVGDMPKTPNKKFRVWSSVICCQCGSVVHGFIQ